MSTRILTKWHREVLHIAQSLGIEDARIEHGGRHPHIVGLVKGRPIKRTIANTPSDCVRAAINTKCDLRRVVRVLSA
jgi:hypothetical protein